MIHKAIFSNRLVLTGAVIIIAVLGAGLLAPLLSVHDPAAISLEELLLAPSPTHLLGTDQLGRDLFTRLLYGTRVSLRVGILAVGIAGCIGVLIGAIAGYFGGRLDSILMRLVDLMLCFPAFFLILSVVAILEPSIDHITLIIGLTSWMGTARLVRAEVLTLKEREFIQACISYGCGPCRIILRHLIPNAISPVIVSLTLSMGSAILAESSLSFLGLGVQPPMPSWGNILLEAKQTMGVAWWLSVFPGLAILVTILGFNLLGEGLRDVLIGGKGA